MFSCLFSFKRFALWLFENYRINLIFDLKLAVSVEKCLIVFVRHRSKLKLKGIRKKELPF